MLAHEATKKGLCNQQLPTLLTTISVGAKQASSLADLQAVLELSRTALRETNIIARTPAYGVFNVILAGICDSKLGTSAGHRVGPNYRHEQSLLDVAERMLVGIQLAEELQIAGVRFSSDDNRNRIESCIRNACAVGVGLGLQRAVACERIEPQTATELAKPYRSLAELPPLTSEEAQSERCEILALRLFERTLATATRCFKTMETLDGAKIVHKHHIDGKTISLLLRGLEVSQITCTPDILKEVATLTHCALAVPAVYRDTKRDAIPSAIRLVNVDSLGPVLRAHCVATILHNGLRKIDDTGLLSELRDVLDAAVREDPSVAEEYDGLKSMIDERVNFVNAERAKKASANPRSDAGQQGGRSANR